MAKAHLTGLEPATRFRALLSKELSDTAHQVHRKYQEVESNHSATVYEAV